MNQYKNLIILLLGIITMIMGSCKKFLSEPPSKSSGVVVSTAADLDGLLNNYSSFAQETLSSYLSTDDYGITPDLWTHTQGVGSTFYTLNTLAVSMFDRTSDLATTNSGWQAEWQKIFTANLVLNNLSKVSGTEAEKLSLKAEAHFVRAYSYFALANVFCLPNTPANANEPGLPIKQTTSFDESTERASVSDTYKLIESDIAAAMAVNVGPVQNGKVRNWRANTAAVHTFAARYYLSQGNYQKAAEEANASLNIYNTLNNYNNASIFFTVATGSMLINRNSTDPNYPEQTFIYKIPSTFYINAPGYAEVTYLRYEMASNPGFIPPSQELANLYDQNNDLRWANRYFQGFTIILSGYVSYPAQQWPSYNDLGAFKIPDGPSVPEAMLIKAECQARSGDFAGAMSTVNALRVTRFKSTASSSIINLAAASQDEAIKKILEERRREMPFGMRYYDLRRLNNNSDPNDDVVVTRTFYNYTNSQVATTGPTTTYILPAKSRLYAFPIPLNDIIAGNGSIKQNTY